ncbi:MAG: glycosyl hydrolase [Bryobacteraceae bacterium]
MRKLKLHLSSRLVLTALACFVLGFGAANAAQPDLEAEFHRPPDSARPWVYWFWLDGNVTREGITADLEAMQRVGIGGVVLMEVDAFIPKGPVRFLTPQWREMFRHALKEAARLNIELSVNNDGGWMGSGGPWVRPEHAMQMTVWSETHVTGPRRFSAILPQPKVNEGYYRDIAVLAFPTPRAEAVRMAAANPKVTWGDQHRPIEAAKLMDGNPGTVEELPALEPGRTHTIHIDFPKPFAASALVVAPDRALTTAKGLVEVSEDGRTFRTIREFVARCPIATVTFDTVTARHFRISLTPEGRTAATLPLGELELTGGGRVEGIESKAAYINDPYQRANTSLPGGSAIAKARVIDLTARLDASGHLQWDVPAGRWTVLRVGYTPTGKKNHPSPKEGLGLECDKLSKAALDEHFAGMPAKLIADQKAAGVNSLRYLHVDSWEAASQNWTARMREEFQRRRGYDLISLLPVLTGRVIGSAQTSERFLWDLRRTLADLVNENYAGHFRELCNRNGLKFSLEPYGNGPLDDLPYAGRADFLLTEFWMGADPWWGVKETISAAHTYGHAVVGAEAFTSRPPAGRWLNHPFRLKPLGDQMFAAGVNRFVFHRFAMQPWLNRFPGMTMGPYGIEFDRTVTWWEQSKTYLTYLARCQHMLQQGRFVADIGYLSNEKVPNDFHEPSTLMPEAPQGYDYDVIPAELLARAEVRDGQIALPSGMTYRVLVLPAAGAMRVAQLRKIKELVEAGATILGPPPESSPSLAESGTGDADVRRMARALWGDCDGVGITEHRVGKGRVVWGKPLVNVLNEAGAQPDFSSLGVETGKQIRYIHRVVDGKDVYFVASAENQAMTFLCSFRVTGRRPELWWPDSGRIEKPAAYERQSTYTRIPIRLDPYGSVFVVFEEDEGADPVVAIERDGAEVSGLGATAVVDLLGKMEGFTVSAAGPKDYRLEAARPGTYRVKTANGAEYSATVSLPGAVEVTGPWEVRFPKGWKAPERITLDRLISWTAHPDDGVKYFSGTATYKRVLTIPAAMFGEGRTIHLDLGRVEVIAEVKLNGRELGTLWKPPFRVEITSAAHPGDNDLEIRVVNLWPNRLIGDEHLPADAEWEYRTLKAWPQWLLEGRNSPTGRVTFAPRRHWTRDDPLVESGLLGPVRLEAGATVRLFGETPSRVSK